MTPKNKFLEHMKGMAMLWIPAVLSGITVLLATGSGTVPILAVAGLGLFLILCSKWRLMRSKDKVAFNLTRLSQAERMFYLCGYFFIACAFFATVYINMMGSVS